MRRMGVELRDQRAKPRRKRVVAIGRDPSGLDADACNAVGVELIAGDPTDPRTLESAGVASAKVLVASCPADDSNVAARRQHFEFGSSEE